MNSSTILGLGMMVIFLIMTAAAFSLGYHQMKIERERHELILRLCAELKPQACAELLSDRGRGEN